MKPIIIIGAGMAGYTVAREFRKLDKEHPLVIVTTDDGSFYSKPMLSNALAQGKSAQQLASQSAAQMAAQLNATIHAATRVQAIDAVNHSIATDAGVLEFGKLVLAVGANPIRIPMAGDAADCVLSVNHLDHYHDFRTRLAEQISGNTRRVTILGAGLIGCEFADDLAGTGYAVTLIDPNRLPLAAIAPPALSQGMADALRAKGIALKLGTTAQSVNRVADGLQLQLADGSQVTVDIVLSAIGLRPDLALAQAAGIATERGIVVDGYGQTSVPDTYALGDCAEYTIGTEDARRTMPYIAPLMAAARAIARSLSGSATLIAHMPAPVIVKTPSYPLALLPPPPHLLAGGQWRDSMQGDAQISRFFDVNGILQGFGVAPQQAALRQQLLGELGKPEFANALAE